MINSYIVFSTELISEGKSYLLPKCVFTLPCYLEYSNQLISHVIQKCDLMVEQICDSNDYNLQEHFKNIEKITS